jgi:predicted nucleotidyltransferase
MQTVGIIAEYNPFHKGHAYQAQQARQSAQADTVIAVMSGHFTQRGEIAIIDKWRRAEAAVKSGIDLVLELPSVFAVRSAQYFAFGGVRLLSSLGIVDYISFGAENSDLSCLSAAAAGLDDPQVGEKLKLGLSRGKNYAAALADALVAGGYTARDFIISPNNILAVEYLRALARYAPTIRPLPVRRIGSGFHDKNLSDCFASATAIRHELLLSGSVTPPLHAALPPATAAILESLLDTGAAPAQISELENIILAKLRSLSDKELLATPEISEGLENRLKLAARNTGNLPELLELAKTKRYPYSRLQRLLVHLLLGTQREQIEAFDASGPLYARVLALNSQGRAALRKINDMGRIPVITKTTSMLNSRNYHTKDFSPLQSMLAVDITATDLFCLSLPCTTQRKGGLDFRQSAIFLPNY